MKVLVTGSAGFIGHNLAKNLLEKDFEVIGVDNFNDYYDPKLKEDRNKELEKYEKFKLYRVDIGDKDALEKVFAENKFDIVVNLAAQASVRYAVKNPYAYANSNLSGFVNVISMAKDNGVKKFVYASSSSVYGDDSKIPFTETEYVDKPISLYAASKRANELIAHVYHHIFGMKTIGLRFFTVYGPWGRPDMSVFKFVSGVIKGEKIPVYNYGKDMKRDFTYIDDIVSGIVLAMESDYDYEIFNLGKGHPDDLGELISAVEKHTGIEAKKDLLPMQQGDVMITYANTAKAEKMLGFEPKVNLDEGVKRFVEWYKQYYNV